MYIKRIRATNFKSFKELDLPLGKLNVIIGANASGKSNLVSFFKLLSDIEKHNLDNAIQLQGGIEYLRNLTLGSDDDFSVSINMTSFPDSDFIFRNDKLMSIQDIEYSFSFKFFKRKRGFNIANDIMKLGCNFYNIEKKVEKKKTQLIKKDNLGYDKIEFYRKNGNIGLIPPSLIELKEDEIIPPIIKGLRFPKNVLLIESPLSFIQPILFDRLFSEIGIYDFDPKLSKESSSIISKSELDSDGKNLALILKNLLENDNSKRMLENLVGDVLPFYDGLEFTKPSDKSLSFKLKEKYYRNHSFPSTLISDGTIHVILLLIALYFESKSIAILEEPERNIHPSLLSNMVSMMKDASRNKQIIITTHNPEIVKHVDIDSLLLVSRDKDGFSKIYKPADISEIQTFLKNDIGVDELYVQNLLEGY